MPFGRLGLGLGLAVVHSGEIGSPGGTTNILLLLAGPGLGFVTLGGGYFRLLG